MVKSDPIIKSVFATDDVSFENRYQTWRDSISVLFDVESHSASPPEGFNAKLTSYLLNDQVMFTHSMIDAQSFLRGAYRTAQDGLDYYLIQTYLVGSQEVSRGRKVNTIRPADGLLVIDLADRYTAHASNIENLTLVIPRHLLASKLTHPDSQQGRILNGDLPLVRLVIEHMNVLYSLADKLTQEDAAATIEPTMALIASALNGSMDHLELSAIGAMQSTLARAKINIENNLQYSDLTPDSLCKHLQLSRASVYRLFQSYGGVNNFIRDRRLQRSAEDLMNPQKSTNRIGDIAYSWGFTSESNFSRSFKKKFDVSPSDLRQMGSLHKPEDLQNSENSYESWLSDTLKT